MMRAAQLVSYEKDFQTNQVDDPTVTDPLDVIVRVGAAGFCRRRAQYLSENSDHPIERIAGQAGFGSPTAFRERFERVVGTAPHT